MMKFGLRGLMEANLSFTFHSYRKENTQLNIRNHNLSVSKSTLLVLPSVMCHGSQENVFSS